MLQNQWKANSSNQETECIIKKHVCTKTIEAYRENIYIYLYIHINEKSICMHIHFFEMDTQNAYKRRFTFN